jgi:hypothetical protein
MLRFVNGIFLTIAWTPSTREVSTPGSGGGDLEYLLPLTLDKFSGAVDANESGRPGVDGLQVVDDKRDLVVSTTLRDRRVLVGL